MMIRCIIWLACLCCMPLSAALRLEYPSNAPVWQTSELMIEALGSLPGLKMHESSRQSIAALLSIPADQQDKTYSTPPFDLTFIFKNYLIHFDVNQKQEKLSSDTPEKLPYYLQNFKLVDLPLKMHIHKERVVFHELPIFKEMQLESFFSEWVQHMFALAGKDLYVGATFEVPFHVNQRESSIRYEIHAVTDKEIQAGFSGKLSNKSPQMTMTGTTEGKVTWNRRNALLCSIQAKHLINSELTNGQESWILNYNLTHQLVSSLYAL